MTPPQELKASSPCRLQGARTRRHFDGEYLATDGFPLVDGETHSAAQRSIMLPRYLCPLQFTKSR